ncbi:epithelial sodium channel subunit alpha-like [Tachypleus tridentatus]|uniref:epithelial sodium channel subunit alpha-like n=1 Tax=Tachypleus tridentatus TaxID=6853 RepID=UPI003FD19274
MTNSKTIDRGCTSKMYIEYFQKVLTILSMVGFIYQCITFYQIFMDYQVTVDFTVQDPEDVDFPAVTLCASSKFPLSTDMEYEPLESLNYSYAKKKSTSLESIIDYFNPKEEKEFVTEYFDSMYGNCFTFNAAWSNRSQVRKSLRESNKNKKEELSFSLQIPTDEYIFIGALVTVHSPYVFPNLRDNSIKLKAGLQYVYFYTQQTSYLLPPPYQTDCTDYDKIGLSTVRPGLLDQKLCYLECVYNRTFEKCGTTNVILFPLAFEAKEKLGRNFSSDSTIYYERPSCLEEAEKDKIFDKYCNDFCRAPCRKIDYLLIRETSLSTKSHQSLQHLYLTSSYRGEKDSSFIKTWLMKTINLRTK